MSILMEDTTLLPVLLVILLFINNRSCSLHLPRDNQFLTQQNQTRLSSGPSFLDQFSEETSEAGPSISLKCVASGHPLPQVTWLLDGLPVPDNSRFRTGDYVTRDSVVVSYVNITSVATQDGGLYECTASNDVSSIKHSARLKIHGPPFVRPMDNVSAVAGEPLVLHCPVAGHPIESIFWEKNNQRLPFNHRQKVYPNGTFILTEVEKNTDEGLYKCQANGRDGKEIKSASSSLSLQVLIRPEIEPFSFPKSLQEGQRFNVLCSVTKGDEPVTIKWFKDSRLLGRPTSSSLRSSSSSSSSSLTSDSNRASELIGISTVSVTAFSSSLIVDSVRPEHRGNYTCEASNRAGSASVTQSMIVHVPPKWVIEPQDASVLRGKTALIDCQADGFPPPSIHWSKTEGETSSSEFKPVISGSRSRVFQNGSLVIHNVQKSDAASYLCQITNGIRSGLSKVIKLVVHISAHFKSKFRAETVRKGQEANLKCEAEGDRPLTITWFRDKVPFNPRESPNGKYDITETQTPTGFTSEIVIRSTDRRDSSLFTCRASNAYGEDETNIQVIMQEAPDAPNEVKVSSYDARSATISWTPPYSGNSPVTHYIVQWKPNDVSDSKWTSKEIINASVSGSENFATLRGLRPITRYDARVIAVNNLGKSDPSEPLRFSTDEEAPGGPPLHIKVTAVSSRSVKVSWKSPREDLRFGTIKGYYVGYKAASTDSDQFIYKTLDATKPDEEECFLHGLKRFTKYSITVQAFNSKGTGPSSEVIETQTLPNDPPSQPILKVNLVTTSSINLGWNVKQLTSNNEDIDPTPVTGFVVHTKKHESSSDWEVLRLSGDRNSHTFERLACGSKYQYYVVAFNAVGKSDPSEITTVKTEGSSPVAPDKHSLLSTNTTAAVIFLDAWHDGGCPISSFDITYRARKSNRVKGESKRVFPGAEKTVILKDLLPSTVYEIKMSAVNEAGITEAVYNFTTGSLIRAVPAGNDMASIHGSALPAPLTIDPIILPTTIALVSVVLLFVVVKLWFFRKRQNPSPSNGVYGSNYGSQGMYDMAKSQAGAESLCLTDMGTTCGVKKVNGCGGSGSSDDSNRDSGVCYPSPYELTKLTCDSNVGLETVTLVRQTNGHTMPLKTGNGNNLDSSSQEPTYATVKRTPRAPRNECHVYQYPLTLMTQDGSFFDAESCVSLGSCNTGPPSSTAYFRVQDDSGSGKPLSSAVPLLISEDGRIAVEGRTLDSIRRNGTNNCQSNFRRDY